MNTAASETVIEMMVKPISFEPLSAASNGSSPVSMWRTMFSSITMASSTTKPMDRISAIIDMLSRLKFSAAITANVPSIVNGSARLGMMVAETLRRNKKITPTTSTSVISMVTWMSLKARRMLSERSPRTSRSSAGGSCDLEQRQQRADAVGDLDGVGAGLPQNLSVTARWLAAFVASV